MAIARKPNSKPKLLVDETAADAFIAGAAKPEAAPIAADAAAGEGTEPRKSPVMLRFEPELLAMLQVAPPDQRKRIIAQQEAVVRGGLVGYDPYAGTQARIIVLG